MRQVTISILSMAKKRLKFSDQIRKAIDDSGTSRYAIWKETGIDQGALSHFMAGNRGLSMDSLDLIAEMLKLDIVRRKRGKGR